MKICPKETSNTICAESKFCAHPSPRPVLDGPDGNCLSCFLPKDYKKDNNVLHLFVPPVK